MHPLLLHNWTPETTVWQATPTHRRPCRPERGADRPRSRLHSRGTGGWRRTVGMWLVEAGLALAVRD